MKRILIVLSIAVSVSGVLRGMDLPPEHYVGSIRFLSPSGIACTESGTVYVLCRRKAVDGGGLYKLECPMGKRLLPFENPCGLLYHRDKLWVTEDYGGDLFVVDLGEMTKKKHMDQFVTPGWKDSDDDPMGMAVAPPGFEGENVRPGDIVVVDRGYTGKKSPWWIHTVDTNTPGRHRTMTANASDEFSGDLFEPSAVAASPDGSLYVAETRMMDDAPSKAGIYNLDSSGQLRPFCVHPSIKSPQAMAVHPKTGDLYVSDEHAGHIFQIDPTGKAIRTFVRAISKPRTKVTASAAFTSLAWSSNGKTLYAGWGSRVLVFTTATDALPACAAMADVKASVRAIRFAKPGGMAVNRDGALYIARRDSVKSGGGIYRIVDGQPSHRLARIQNVADMAFASDGALLVSQDYEGHISRIPPGSHKPTTIVTGGKGFSGGDPDDDPTGLCIAPEGFQSDKVSPGDLIVVDRGALQGGRGPHLNWLYTVKPDAPHDTRVLHEDTDGQKPGPMGDPRGVAATPDGRVFVADPCGDGHIWELKPDGAISELRTVDRAGKPVLIRDAASVACQPGTGMLYVTDGYLDQVFRVDPRTGVSEPFATGFIELLGGSRCNLAWNTEGTILFVGDWEAGLVYEFTFGK